MNGNSFIHCIYTGKKKPSTILWMLVWLLLLFFASLKNFRQIFPQIVHFHDVKPSALIRLNYENDYQCTFDFGILAQFCTRDLCICSANTQKQRPRCTWVNNYCVFCLLIIFCSCFSLGLFLSRSCTIGGESLTVVISSLICVFSQGNSIGWSHLQ